MKIDSAMTGDSITATDRFFQACDELLFIGKASSIRDLCRTIGYDRRNFTNKKNGMYGNSNLRPEYLTALVLKYGISADWLLTGRGWMFGE